MKVFISCGRASCQCEALQHILCNLNDPSPSWLQQYTAVQQYHTGSGAANKNLPKSLFFTTIHFCLISKGCISCDFFVNRLIKYLQIIYVNRNYFSYYYSLPKLVEIVSYFTYSLELIPYKHK